MSISLPEPVGSLLKKIESASITNFYGGPGTGKTNMCIFAVLECLKSGGSAIFIDTEGGLSMERIGQIEPDCQNLLKRMGIIQPKTFGEQGKIIRELEKQKTDLIVLDSAVALYRLEYADGLAENGLKRANSTDEQILTANRELSKQLSILSGIARNKNIPVIITAHTFRNFKTGEDDMIGGELIKYWSKAIVFLEKTGKTSERKATVVKHRSLPEGSSAKFDIIESGIKPAGFKIF